MILVWIFQVIFVCLVGAAFAWAPSWRKDLLFGSRVQPAFRSSAEAQRLLRGHYRVVILSSIVSVVLISVALYRQIAWLVGVAPMVQVAGCLISYARGWRVARPHAKPAEAVRTASLAPPDTRLTGGLLAWTGPFLILGAAAVVVWAHWDELPARVAVHWGVSGPDAWGEKSWRSVFGVLIIGAWTLLLTEAIGVAIVKGSRSPQTPGGWGATHRRMNIALLLGIAYIIALMLANIAVAPVYGRGGDLPVSGWVAPVALLAAIGVAVWRMIANRGQASDEPDPTPEECWSWGEIYYNPNDPVVVVPKRSGFGYTLNFANPITWALGAIMIALPLLIFFVVP